MMEPSEGPSPSLVEVALQDLRNRTLAKLAGDLARLVCLASTRDYNAGRCTHDGLSFRFSESVAETVLAATYREAFASLALSLLRVLVSQWEHYIRSGWAHPDELVGAWNSSEAYRILPPAAGDPLTVRIFISNVKIALAIVEAAWQEPQALQDPRSASQLPSPGR